MMIGALICWIFCETPFTIGTREISGRTYGRRWISDLMNFLQSLRPAKTKLKVSGCFLRTEVGAQNYATVASVIQTALKNGQNPFEVLRVIATLALA